jgi:broad specificity phosphatase PhoE
MNRSRRRLLLRLAPLLAVGAAAGSARADEAAWRALAAGGCALLLRHASTVPGIGDPPGFRLDDCATQRNLSEAGRIEARAFGAELSRRGVAFDAVLSSRWCRCLETARLAFPRNEVEVLESLNSFFADGSTRAAQTAALRAWLARQGARRRVALVTHMVNITALTGESVAMGEAVIVRLGPDGAGAVLGRLRA